MKKEIKSAGNDGTSLYYMSTSSNNITTSNSNNLQHIKNNIPYQFILDSTRFTLKPDIPLKAYSSPTEIQENKILEAFKEVTEKYPTQRWTPNPGQFGGVAKVDIGVKYHAAWGPFGGRLRPL